MSLLIHELMGSVEVDLLHTRVFDERLERAHSESFVHDQRYAIL